MGMFLLGFLYSCSLLSLVAQIRSCDSILEVMEQMLGGFQSDLSNISSEIKHLQEQSLSMSVKLRNRKVSICPAASGGRGP